MVRTRISLVLAIMFTINYPKQVGEQMNKKYQKIEPPKKTDMQNPLNPGNSYKCYSIILIQFDSFWC
jgi:hypothetical protein